MDSGDASSRLLYKKNKETDKWILSPATCSFYRVVENTRESDECILTQV